MIIQTESKNTARLMVDGVTDGYVEFNKDGKARVKKEVGRKLIEMYDKIQLVSDESKSEDDDTEDEDQE